jgi:GDP-mannose 6-dehydrogenase
MIARTGKKKIGMFGLSFKPDTDDLRESPMVELAEKLIGKGYDVIIYDQEVSLARIFGANKQYIEQVIPHISSLIMENVKEFTHRSEVIVFAKKSKISAEVLKNILYGTTVIDLVRVTDKFLQEGIKYDGICW